MAPEPVQVRVQQAVARTLDKSIDVTGSLDADETVNLSFEIAGRVSRFRVDFGQLVKKGDIIAELDPRDSEWALERAKANVSQLAARLGMKKWDDPYPTSTAAIRQAQANLEDAKSKYDSAAKLVQSGDISKERAVELQKTLQARQAMIDATNDELNMMIAQLRAQKADLEIATKRLSDNVIRAPFDGGISAKLVSPGQYIKENTAVATLVKTSPLRLRVEIPETYSALIRPGSVVTFTTDAAPGKEFNASIQKLNPSFDSKNRTLLAESKIPASDPRLRPGTFVQVKLVTQRAEQVVMVPKQAIYSVAGLSKVYVVRNGKAVEVKIPPAAEIDGWAEAPAGTIQPGDSIAVSNLLNLVNGVSVKTL
ncbi:efflux RND transporter periplasmic adaptor subunit [Bryobacter aggregatus]|uniref:efflux RND transporter periplasmic adaptor subunit n=1 Tax=Bryobacter aggregatus TaxID=360054 RepID=UPI00138E3372|nr:efflux RND transporter periplasmic adaptor subunit [Bryobacter aggregatus]